MSMLEQPPPSDDGLILLIAGGDREAFALLYRRYRVDVYRFAAHMSGSAAIAEDVVQDVFVAVIEDASRLSAGPIRRPSLAAGHRAQPRQALAKPAGDASPARRGIAVRTGTRRQARPGD